MLRGFAAGRLQGLGKNLVPRLLRAGRVIESLLLGQFNRENRKRT
jgi:hypothetical protein